MGTYVNFSIGNVSLIIFNDTANSTESPNIVPQGPRLLDRISDGVVAITLIVLMLGMGCTIEVKKLLKHLRRPFGPAVGMVCQLVVLPLTAFGVAHALKLNPYNAIGLIVLAATPGGSMSNLFAYWADGDVPLRFVNSYTTCLNFKNTGGHFHLNVVVFYQFPV